MNALDFYKFIKYNGVEFNLTHNSEKERDVILFVNFVYLHTFTKLISNICFDVREIKCVLRENHICVFASDVVSDDIELTEIFGEDKGDE